MRLVTLKLAATILVAIVTLSTVALARADLSSDLARSISGSGAATGAWVYNASENRVVFSYRAGTKRTLASNQKLLTASTALERWGSEHRIETVLYGTGTRDGSIWRGNLYLKGFGDPTLSTENFANRHLSTVGNRLNKLAETVAALGISEVTGEIYGDESFFDSRRGVPSSNYRTSFYVGPLSALALNTGHSNLAGTIFQRSPATFAADRLTAVLRDQGVEVERSGAAAKTPAAAEQLATAESAPIATLVRIMNKSSNNYFAEMIAKGLGANFGASGSTNSGADVIENYVQNQGLSAQATDGSGLARSNRASPRTIGLLLDKLRGRSAFSALYSSLPIAGRDGTLRKRMRGTAGQGRVRAKTGTLNGVSTLSGYIKSRSGKTYIFSILMNNIAVYKAHAVQDQMASLIASY